MWSLSRCNGDQSTVHLLVGRDYVIGRKDCAIIIKDDPSISRKHAVLNVQYDFANLGDINRIPEVTLSDTSKYGTAINGVKVTEPTKLNSGDEICFGTHQSIYRIIYTPLVVITSCLESSNKKQLKKQVHLLGGHVLNEWKKDHVTHLAMDSLLFTIKVIHALAGCCQIVAPSFFDATIQAIEAKQTLPTPKLYLPPLKEKSIKSSEPLFIPDNKRKSLFHGKTFFFLSEKQFNRTHEAVETCGGTTNFLDPKVTFPHDKKLVAEETCVMMVDQKERQTLAVDIKGWITELMEFLRSNNKRPIPESELGLAILQMTLQNYCNPNIEAVPAITQNIVCQSLNVGLDEMSQIYSPQKTQPIQFKNSSGPENIKDQKQQQSHKKSEMKPRQSTVTPKTPMEAKRLREDVKATRVKETPENAMTTGRPAQEPVSPIPGTLNISGEGHVFVTDTPVRPSQPSIASHFAKNNKTKDAVAESLGFDSSRNHRESGTSFEEDDTVSSVSVTSRRPANNPEAVQFSPVSLSTESVDVTLTRSSRETDAVPDSLNLSLGETECDRRNIKHTHTSTSSRLKTERVVPDSVGFAESIKDIERKISFDEQDPIPESMDIDDTHTRMSTSRDGLQTSAKEESQALNSYKRRRVTTEDAEDPDSEDKKLPNKRLKSSFRSGNDQEVRDDVFSRLGRDEWNKNTEDNGGSTEQQGCQEATSLSVPPRDTVSNGFISVSKTATTKPVQVENGQDNDEDGLPRNLVVVDVVSLVVRRPGGQEREAATSFEVVGKNFKKFKKQRYAGCDRRFPKIIGGSDLVVHQALANAEHEDWFIQAKQASQEQEQRDRVEEQLFTSDAGLPRQRKRQAR